MQLGMVFCSVHRNNALRSTHAVPLCHYASSRWCDGLFCTKAHSAAYMINNCDVVAAPQASRGACGAGALSWTELPSSSISGSLSCPIHCHPSAILPFLAGLTTGIVLGVLLGFWIFWTCIAPLFSYQVPHESSVPRPGPRAPSRCLHAYVHE